MRQVFVRNVANCLRNVGHQWNRTHQPVRCLATVKEIFPNKVDFPSRHIGPRKTDVVQMLDLLGYKVDNHIGRECGLICEAGANVNFVPSHWTSWPTTRCLNEFS